MRRVSLALMVVALAAVALTPVLADPGSALKLSASSETIDNGEASELAGQVRSAVRVPCESGVRALVRLRNRPPVDDVAAAPMDPAACDGCDAIEQGTKTADRRRTRKRLRRARASRQAGEASKRPDIAQRRLEDAARLSKNQGSRAGGTAVKSGKGGPSGRLHAVPEAGRLMLTAVIIVAAVLTQKRRR